MSIAINVSNLNKTYPKANSPSVEGLSFQLEAGQILALLGPNGAGKTTTVKMIAGLVTPTSGTVAIQGQDVIKARRKAVSHLGAVLEGARNLYWRLTAVQNLQYFGRLRLVPEKELISRIDKLLERFDLSQHRDKSVGQFSRGMQQKVAIAAALLHDPAVLLLDEPTLGLDVEAARQLEAEVQRMAQIEGKAVLLTTHQMPLAEKLADQILVIHQGNEVASGPTSELLSRYSEHREVTEIQIEGKLSEPVESLLGQTLNPLIIQPANGTTTLSTDSLDQDKLLAVLNLLHQHQVSILSYGQRRATLEEIFLALTKQVSE